MTLDARASSIAVPGFVDHHTHLLTDSSGVGFPWGTTPVREYHQQVWRDGSTPMDAAEPVSAGSLDQLADGLHRGLADAAQLGLVEVTEMGLRDWRCLDALTSLQAGPPGQRAIPPAGIRHRGSRARAFSSATPDGVFAGQ